jgi:hypothetical protein
MVVWWSGCGCGCGARMATPPACWSAAPPRRAPGSKSLLSAFLHVLLCMRCISGVERENPDMKTSERERVRAKFAVQKLVSKDEVVVSGNYLPYKPSAGA